MSDEWLVVGAAAAVLEVTNTIEIVDPLIGFLGALLTELLAAIGNGIVDTLIPW